MRQIEKDKLVWIRKGATVLRGDAPAEGKDTRVQEVLEAPVVGTVVESPMTSLRGAFEIAFAGGKKAVVSVRRVLCPGVIAAQAGGNVTVLPSSEILSTP